MRPQHVLRFLLLNGLAVGLGATVATSCIAVNYPTVAFRCDPRQGDNCPDSHFCCSDDPSTADGALPAYVGKNIPGSSTPLYADTANRAGTSGMCVNTDDIPAGQGLLDPAAANCPIPCNPKWDAGDVAAVCGPARVCCQTVELEDKDCVQEDGVWRAVSGADIGDGDVVPATNWNNVAHATHQDPNGTVCAAVSGGAGTAAFAECITHLSVADQRGFCMGLQAGQQCPTTQPTYVNACAAKNGTPPPAGG
jgi:hypothetical protein